MTVCVVDVLTAYSMSSHVCVCVCVCVWCVCLVNVDSAPVALLFQLCLACSMFNLVFVQIIIFYDMTHTLYDYKHNTWTF